MLDRRQPDCGGYLQTINRIDKAVKQLLAAAV